MVHAQFTVIYDEKSKDFIIVPMWSEDPKYVANIKVPYLKREILEIILNTDIDDLEDFFNYEGIEFYSGSENTEKIEDIWEAYHGFHGKG